MTEINYAFKLNEFILLCFIWNSSIILLFLLLLPFAVRSPEPFRVLSPRPRPVPPLLPLPDGGGGVTPPAGRRGVHLHEPRDIRNRSGNDEEVQQRKSHGGEHSPVLSKGRLYKCFFGQFCFDRGMFYAIVHFLKKKPLAL